MGNQAHLHRPLAAHALMAAWAAMGASINISSEAMINHPCFDGSQMFTTPMAKSVFV